jgi:hypothetical protein
MRARINARDCEVDDRKLPYVETTRGARIDLRRQNVVKTLPVPPVLAPGHPIDDIVDLCSIADLRNAEQSDLLRSLPGRP